VTSGVSHGFRGVHKSGGTDESVGFTAAARQIAAVVTAGVSHGFRGVRAVFLQLPAYGHYSFRFERGMQIIRTTPNLWELLELCDSGEAVVQTLMYGLTDCVRCRRDLRCLPGVSRLTESGGS
jgi:hypothetical protein